MTTPRVFISYARKDGEQFATDLRKRLELEEPEITLWQDRAGLEGGEGWWKQITDVLDQVRFLVLIVTPGSLESEMVQKEWRYARQQGVCVYPVNAAPDRQLDFDRMPLWMRRAHFHDLDHEWQTFVNHLKSPCHANRVQLMAPDLPSPLVERPALTDRLVQHLLTPDRVNPVATTVALYGSGGFGKTTLATQFCHRDEVKTAFVDGILWATLGEKPNLLAELTKLYAALSRERQDFVSPDHAAIELSRLLDERTLLLVIDDVWDPGHLAPFMRGGSGCTRLVTTRQMDVVIKAAGRIDVDEMTTAEATALLAGYLRDPPPDLKGLEALASRLGEWPLLLELAGSVLRKRLEHNDTLAGALAYLNEALDEEGVTAFDRRDPQQRRQAVGATLAVSLDLLSEEERRQYRALAIFPEDAAVPMSAVGTLLGLGAYKTGKLLETLASHALLKLDLGTGTLRLHDVVRAYLASELDDARALHARLADAWSTPDQLPDAYAWRHAVHHMIEALPAPDAEEYHPRTRRLVEFVSHPVFRQGHFRRLADPPALERDLERALRCAVRDLHAEAPELVVRLVRAQASFDGHSPAWLFDLAREGELERAEPLLELYGPEEWWRQAVLLVLAWQAAASGYGAPASALLARLEQEVSPYDPVLTALLARVRSAILPGVPPPPSQLPDPPDQFIVSQIQQRLGGTSLTPIEPLLISGLEQMGDEAPAYLAEQDGPLLVAFANADPQHNTAYLRQYIDAHASNPYRYYRNRSLWALIPAVVQHESPAWILEILQELMTGALTRTRIDFRSALPLTLRGLRARGGDATALRAFENDCKRTRERVQTLSPERGAGDPWAHCLRRLAALAEVRARVLGQIAEARELLNEAVQLPFEYSFAGFRAPACLTLAESLRVCGWDDPARVRQVLYSGLSAAHNVQDADFCAQVTARINAMQLRWWPQPPATLDIVATVERFTRDPHAAEFAAVHRAGDAYERRSDAPTRLRLPDAWRSYRTFHEITFIYPSMRLEAGAEAEALNPQLRKSPDQPLPEGTPVNVPDPEFAPLLAARLAAEVLAADGLTGAERTSLIQRLVPIAVADRTALDTVTARLLMATLAQG